MRHYLKSTAVVPKKPNQTCPSSADLAKLPNLFTCTYIYVIFEIFAAYVYNHNLNSHCK